jgi:prepilin-type N-terminal cleavage/methylation domain-containing protein
VALNRAFSLLEMIFAIIIIGILAGVGIINFNPNYLQRDAEFVLGKIKEARFKGVGYNKIDFNSSDINFSIGCIELNRDSLNSLVEDKKDYELKSEIEPSVKLCFDHLGRPHIDDEYTKLDTLLPVPLEINITYNGNVRTIIVLPMSGYAEIPALN